ncbi:MAG: hypothetical protein M3R24_03055 [Chloroflexota bacterium]|nr:hypothetical protein [Chloroflexota bacterium]
MNIFIALAAADHEPDTAGAILTALYIILPFLLAMVVGVLVIKLFFRIRPLWHYLERPEYQRVLRAKLDHGDYMFVLSVVEHQKAGKPVSGKELRNARRLIISTLAAAGVIE